MRKARRALGGAVLTITLASNATVAHAAHDTWFSGGLSPEAAVASNEAHSILSISGFANANGFCIAKDTGFAGLGSTTNGTAGGQSCATSGGFVARSENGACCFHGWIGNPLSISITVSPSTRYDY
jgi:hypothetical protein